MKTTALIWLAAVSIAFSQLPPATATQENSQAVETLNLHLTLRERRLAELTTEIMERSQRTDARIGELVTLLTGVLDSQASRRIGLLPDPAPLPHRRRGAPPHPSDPHRDRDQPPLNQALLRLMSNWHFPQRGPAC